MIMMSVRVFVCLILIIWELHCVQAVDRGKTDWSSPIDFEYTLGDELNINIVLRNITPQANNYALFYEIEDAIRGMIPSNRTIHFTKKLYLESAKIAVHILTDNTISSTKNIMTGKIIHEVNTSLKEDENKFQFACLNKKENFCRINVDFSNTGKDNVQEPANIICTRDHNRYTCTSPDEDSRPDTEHQWIQTDERAISIGTIPLVVGRRSNYTFVKHKFDQMSRILWYSKIHDNYIKAEFENTLSNYVKYKVTNPKPYSEKEEVRFTCENLAHTQIGVIDPTGYRITTHPRNLLQSFSKADNGSMLCCLHYNVYLDERNIDTKIIHRSVECFQLIYKEVVNHNNEKEVTSAPTPTTDGAVTQHTNTDDHTANTLKPAVQEQTPTESPHYVTDSVPAGSVADPQETHQTSDYTKYYIAMALAAVAILLASLIYVIVKKCTRKASDPEVKLQLETYASTDLVYAQLDIRPGTGPPPAPTTEDTTYAKIVGVLKPVNNNVKK